jgi:hypothetical protein
MEFISKILNSIICNITGDIKKEKKEFEGITAILNTVKTRINLVANRFKGNIAHFGTRMLESLDTLGKLSEGVIEKVSNKILDTFISISTHFLDLVENLTGQMKKSTIAVLFVLAIIIFVVLFTMKMIFFKELTYYENKISDVQQDYFIIPLVYSEKELKDKDKSELIDDEVKQRVLPKCLNVNENGLMNWLKKYYIDQYLECLEFMSEDDIKINK